MARMKPSRRGRPQSESPKVEVASARGEDGEFRMEQDSCSSEQRQASVLLPDGSRIAVADAGHLKCLLKGLPLLQSGETITLSRDHRAYIRAHKHGDGWSAVTRRGGWWTVASFTAEMTTGYSEHLVRRNRTAGSPWRRLVSMMSKPSAERSLSMSQIETIFFEFFEEKRFSIPQSGA